MDSPRKKLSREELYEEVWQTPIHRLSVKYGLSDVGLAKACKRMDIPRPPRGYWRRVQTGAEVRKTPLPKAKESTVLEVTLRQKGEVPAKRKVEESRLQPSRVPSVNESLADPHPLVAAAKQRLENAKEDKCGILVPRAKRVLALSVSGQQVDRCLRLMDTLIKSWEADGLEVRLIREVEDGSFGTYLCAKDERLGLSIVEGTEDYDPGPTPEERLRPKWEWKTRTACRATGHLTFQLNGDLIGWRKPFHRRYADLLKTPIEGRAMRIWSAAMDYFEKRKQHHAREEAARRRREQEAREWEERRQREEEERARRMEEERRQQEEQRKIQELADAARSWATAGDIRNFIAACEAKMWDQELDWETIEKWTSWAREAADRIDPLVQGFPHLAVPESAESDDEE